MLIKLAGEYVEIIEHTKMEVVVVAVSEKEQKAYDVNKSYIESGQQPSHLCILVIINIRAADGLFPK